MARLNGSLYSCEEPALPSHAYDTFTDDGHETGSGGIPDMMIDLPVQ